MHTGKSYWRGTKCVRSGCQGPALEPGSSRLTWLALRKHRCQVLSYLEASSLCSRSSPDDSEPLLASSPTWLFNRLAKVGHARSQCKEVHVMLLLQTAFLSSSSGPRLYFSSGFRTIQAQNAEPGWEVWWEGGAGRGVEW